MYCGMEDDTPGVRQCPGYAGFVPRKPTAGDLQKRSEPTHMVSTMKANYRELPVDEYRKQTFAKKGPMSRTVTLTYPFNPYNKI
ncbi:spermatogenesis-associated protein 48-like [Ostrea edulis]|uniref:spermatogenesis-associated protein 48-like n=1 Tax=Ostrea edulis TaxID=37623 RepID=UPI002095698B|nr:spermatogenesis-associated protein 48-like [Ostrea edulis]